MRLVVARQVEVCEFEHLLLSLEKPVDIHWFVVVLASGNSLLASVCRLKQAVLSCSSKYWMNWLKSLEDLSLLPSSRVKQLIGILVEISDYGNLHLS